MQLRCYALPALSGAARAAWAVMRHSCCGRLEDEITRSTHCAANGSALQNAKRVPAHSNLVMTGRAGTHALSSHTTRCRLIHWVRVHLML